MIDQANVGGLGDIIQERGASLERTDPPKRNGSLAKVIISPDAIRLLPADFVKRHRVLPFEIRQGTLYVATAEPGNQRVIDDIRLIAQCYAPDEMNDQVLYIPF